MCSSDAKGGRTKRQNQKDPDFEASDFSKRDGQCAGMAVWGSSKHVLTSKKGTDDDDEEGLECSLALTTENSPMKLEGAVSATCHSGLSQETGHSM